MRPFTLSCMLGHICSANPFASAFLISLACTIYSHSSKPAVSFTSTAFTETLGQAHELGKWIWQEESYEVPHILSAEGSGLPDSWSSLRALSPTATLSIICGQTFSLLLSNFCSCACLSQGTRINRRAARYRRGSLLPSPVRAGVWRQPH